MDGEASKQVVLEYLKARGSGDDARSAELLDDDVEWRTPESSDIGQTRGREAVLRMQTEVGPKFFDLSTMKVDLKWIIAEGDKVVVRNSSTAKAANGRDYSNEYIWVYVVRDGRIALIEEHVDTKRFSDIVLT